MFDRHQGRPFALVGDCCPFHLPLLLRTGNSWPSVAHMKANGARIRELREAKPLGLRAFARMAEINCSNLSRLERGQKTASRETLERIADLLGAPFDEIAA